MSAVRTAENNRWMRTCTKLPDPLYGWGYVCFELTFLYGCSFLTEKSYNYCYHSGPERDFCFRCEGRTLRKMRILGVNGTKIYQK